MLLSGEQICARGLISDASSERYRASSYDLSVGDIVPAPESTPGQSGPNGFGVITGREYLLPPQGMVRVISRESVRLDEQVTGYALLKNALCSAGVLAINIGIIDPGYEGPVSSTLINFGKTAFVLAPGMPFLRLSFHDCPQSPKARESRHWTRPEYMEHTREQVLTRCGFKFLNLEETAKAAGKKAFGDYKEWLMSRATVAGLVLAAATALITILVPLWAAYADRYLVARDRWQSDAVQSISSKVAAEQNDTIRRLQAEMNSLKTEVVQLRAERPEARQ
jgi:deoxycytidine triphosphate deaminase